MKGMTRCVNRRSRWKGRRTERKIVRIKKYVYKKAGHRMEKRTSNQESNKTTEHISTSKKIDGFFFY